MSLPSEKNDFNDFFHALIPPESFDNKKHQIESFVKSQTDKKERIVLVTVSVIVSTSY